MSVDDWLEKVLGSENRPISKLRLVTLFATLATYGKRTFWLDFVLNELHATLQSKQMKYWRDKRGHEVDFVYLRRGRNPTAIECKWSADDFDARNLLAFRGHHKGGDNYVVCADVERSFTRKYKQVSVRFVNLARLVNSLSAH